MRLIDRYAYTNRFARVHPAAKAGLAFWVILLCLGLNHPIVGLLAMGWMAGLGVAKARIPAKVFGRLLLAEGTFLVLTSLGVAISMSSVAPADIWQRPFGPLWISTSPAALLQMLQLITRALGAAAALNFLALTTPLVDMIHLLRQLHLPEALIDVMVIMYRFIFVLLDTLERMITAQTSRLGYQTGYKRTMHNAGQLGARLFINTLQRTKRLETAVAARGFVGQLQVLRPAYQPFPHFPVWIFLITITLFLVRFGVLWRS